MVGKVRPDKADTQDDEGHRERIDSVLSGLVVLGHQNASNEERQDFKTIELGRVGTRLPALKISKPASRVVVVKAAFTARFAKAL